MKPSEKDSVQLPHDNDPVNDDGTTALEKPITDQWIAAELNLPQGERYRNAKDSIGNVIGTYNPNPFLNTTAYNVEFLDGKIKEYYAAKYVCTSR